MDKVTKAQLEIAAVNLGLEVPSRATKQELFEAVVLALQRAGRLPPVPKEQKERKKEREPYFLDDTDLPESDRKYCRCVVHVGEKQPDWCLRERAFRQIRDGRKCYNPWAVCHASVKNVGQPECSGNFDFNQFTDRELLTYVLLFHDQVLRANKWREIPVGQRQLLVEGLTKWRNERPGWRARQEQQRSVARRRSQD